MREAGYDLIIHEKTAKNELDREKEARRLEMATLTRKLTVGAILSLVIFIGSLKDMFPWAPAFLSDHYLLAILATPVQFWVG